MFFIYVVSTKFDLNFLKLVTIQIIKRLAEFAWLVED